VKLVRWDRDDDPRPVWQRPQWSGAEEYDRRHEAKSPQMRESHKQHKWTYADIEFLKKNYFQRGGMTGQECALSLGVTAKAVYRMIFRLRREEEHPDKRCY